MKKKFEISYLGMLHYFLELEAKQVQDAIFVSQRKYAVDLLKRFNMLNCKIAVTPMNLNEKLQVDDGTVQVNASHFRSYVGGLIYLMHTRPYIIFSIGVISRFIHSPSKHHLDATKSVLCYVTVIIDFGLWYGRVSDFRLIGFIDNDWAGCLEDRRSTLGYIFNLGSGAISWRSKKQSTIALSSSEAMFRNLAKENTCRSLLRTNWSK
ncbi:secreted RxLR effector protein 161-like [Hevea brasiliensis]|uniref:secreted RxLR effector protein 161-like n=1 Tax=Hevea brasiliensis TaxID=3981 RepID=UPI0025D74061|nr:secreted RxLR effector protein 161-like [Hevea brasiliensis]